MQLLAYAQIVHFMYVNLFVSFRNYHVYKGI